MLYFYKTPVIINTTILNDGYDIKLYDSYAMPNEELKDHYFHNNMEILSDKISYKELIEGDFTLALNIPDMYAFVKEWYSKVPYFNTVCGNFNIREWFKDYLESYKTILLNSNSKHFYNYYDHLTLEYIENMLLDNNFTKNGINRVDFTGWGGNRLEYTWALEDTLASCELGVHPNHLKEISPILAVNNEAQDIFFKNLESLGVPTINNSERKIFTYVNIMGLQDGRFPNFKYILKCLEIIERGQVYHAQ